VPGHVVAAVGQALEKLPADRSASARAFAGALGDAGFGGGTTAAATQTRAAGPVSGYDSRFAAVAALALVLAIVGVWGWLRPAPEAPVTRQQVTLWRDIGAVWPSVVRTLSHRSAIAPDGSQIVFVDTADGTQQLFLKERGDAYPRPLSGTEGAVAPFFSPDGAWIAYTTRDGRLRKVPSSGGGSVTVSDSAGTLELAGGTWLDDGTILYTQLALGISRLPADGGTGMLLPGTGSATGFFGTSMRGLPGSRGFLLTRCAGNCLQSSLYVYDLERDTMRLLVEGAIGGWYTPTGYLLYTEGGGGLFATRFDPATLEIEGGAISVLPNVLPNSFELSASGVALYVEGDTPGAQSTLEWVSRDGSTEPAAPGWSRDFSYPAISPDGGSVAVSVTTGLDTHLWVKQFDGGQQKLTFEGFTNWRPIWSTDGESIGFVSNRSTDQDIGGWDLYRRRADGSALPELLLDLEAGVWEFEYTRDGNWMAYRADEAGNNSNIYARDLFGTDAAAIPIAASPALERQIALSPDGRWMAYISDESGRFEVYVVPFPDADSRWLVSSTGGSEPRWAHSGRELFFRDGAGRFVVVDVAVGAGISFGEPRVLFPATQYISAQNRQQYDVAPDDQRFLMIPSGQIGQSRLIYVENWLQELEQLMEQ
jgi:serine/threonine-protein kinase